jgi:beta-glucanase (GH16 family)
VRGRLAFATLAVFAALAVVAWGLLSGAGPRSGNSTSSAGTLSGSSASASPSVSRSSNAPALTAGMHLVFDPSFRGSSLNTSVWDTCYPGAVQSVGCTNTGNSGKEIEWYLPSQVQVSGGVLDLTARRAVTSGFTKTGTPKTYDCRSGMVNTQPSFNFKYGYIQIVAHITNGTGLWPALWLAASNLKWPPEMDLLEHWGPPRDFSGMFFHPIGAGQVVQAVPENVTSGWQVFALDWTPSKLTWYLNGKTVFSITQDIPHQKMYFIANVAVFKKRGGNSCSGTLKIRSVKVWQN